MQIWNCRLDTETRAALKMLAKRTDRTEAGVVRHLVKTAAAAIGNNAPLNSLTLAGEELSGAHSGVDGLSDPVGV